MSAPSVILDADLGEWDKISYFAIDDGGCIWRTMDLGGGLATWTKVYDAATQFAGGHFNAFLRIRCAPGTPSQIVYALGYGENETSGVWQPFILRSENNGQTWSQTWIDETLPDKDYTVDHQEGDTIGVWPSCSFTRAYTRKGTGAYAVALRFTSPNFAALTHNANTIYNMSDTTLPTGIVGYSKDDDVVGTGYMDDYFGAGNWTAQSVSFNPMPVENNRVNFILGNAYPTYCEQWVFWASSRGQVPKALDVARGIPNVLFIGLIDKIITSTDGGFTWSDSVTTHGAYDICIDPQLGGVIYYWATDGTLRCAIAGVPQAALLSGDTGGEEAGFLRIARDFNTGKIWAVHNTDLKQRDLAVWSTQKSGLLNARGLRVFMGTPHKLALLDDTNIYLSLDAGATWANKKGGWAAYAAPRTIHLLGSP